TGNVTSIGEASSADDYVASLTWSSDGEHLAIGMSDGDAQIWDVSKEQKIRSMLGHSARVAALSWRNFVLSSGCKDGNIWNHDIRIAEHRMAELSGHRDEVCGLKWRSDGLQLASGGNDNRVNIWDCRSSLPKYSKEVHVAAVKAIAWCPWQTNLLASGGGSHDRTIHFWNTSNGNRLQSINTGSQVTSIVWSREYKELLSTHGFPDNNLTIWAYPSLQKIENIKAHDTRVLHSTLSPDGQFVATASSDENLKFWKIFESRGKSIRSKNGEKQNNGTLENNSTIR
ncbi:2270_t:CDS:2, partial [Ambispora leptoticha]